MKQITTYLLFVLLFSALFFISPQQTLADAVIAIKMINKDSSVLRDDLETPQITLSKNTIVSVLAEQDGWAKISYKTVIGYVPLTSLKTVEPELKLVSSKNPPFVRTTNNFESQTVGNLYKNSIVEVYAVDKKGWAFVRYGNLIGFVIDHALTSPTKKTLMVDDMDGLEVKQIASPSGNIVGKLTNGTKVEVYTTFQDWSYVVTNNLQGYVIASKLKAVPISTTPPPGKIPEKYNHGVITSTKRVALTFDDGPHPTVTRQILKTLKKYDAKATFFVTGHRVKANPHILKEIFKAGHEIGNHTYKHAKLTTIPLKEAHEQISSTDVQIKAVIDQNSTLFRPPYGAYNAEIQAQLSVPLIMWSIDTLDWNHHNPEKTLKIVKDQTKNGSIILMHDIHQTTADALDSVMSYLSKQKYEFVTVSEILQ